MVPNLLEENIKINETFSEMFKSICHINLRNYIYNVIVLVRIIKNIIFFYYINNGIYICTVVSLINKTILFSLSADSEITLSYWCQCCYVAKTTQLKAAEHVNDAILSSTGKENK